MTTTGHRLIKGAMMWNKRNSPRAVFRTSSQRWSGVGVAAALSAGLMLTPVHAQTPASDPLQSRIERQLAFGEFGRALDTARRANDPAVRDRLLQQIADAQLQAGETGGSLGTTRQIDGANARSQARDRQSRQQMLGGGAQADFQTLINLIKKETSTDTWDDNGGTGTITEYPNGVSVDPTGLLMQLKKEEHTGRLKALGVAARKADLNSDVAKTSEVRFISLARLEREVSKRLAEGRPIVETTKNLGGLTRIQYIVLDQERHDVLIGGPAEAWRYDSNGNPVGADSGRPTVQLDDFVTVLRTFSRGGAQNFGCSFNPRKEGLQRLQEYVAKSNARGPLTLGLSVTNWVKQLQTQLGPQDVELWGVPRDSRVARVVTEADYRLKMIGIGKLEGGPSVPSIFELMTVAEQKSGSIDALRWWLTMKYDAILHSPDNSVFEIQGVSVQCLSENQFLTEKGERVGTGKADATNQKFAANFTEHYAELARRDIAFADLQNVFDLALVSALLTNEQAANRVGWDFGAFAPDGQYRPAVYAPPTQVESVANHHVYRGKDIVVQVAGGVRGDLMTVVKDSKVRQPSPSLQKMTAQSKSPELPAGRWWWDAK